MNRFACILSQPGWIGGRFTPSTIPRDYGLVLKSLPHRTRGKTLALEHPGGVAPISSYLTLAGTPAACTLWWSKTKHRCTWMQHACPHQHTSHAHPWVHPPRSNMHRRGCMAQSEESTMRGSSQVCFLSRTCIELTPNPRANCWLAS